MRAEAALATRYALSLIRRMYRDRVFIALTTIVVLAGVVANRLHIDPVIQVAFGTVAMTLYVLRLFLLDVKHMAPASVRERLNAALNEVNASSARVDEALGELSLVARDRQRAVDDLERVIGKLDAEQKALESLRPEAAVYLASELTRMQRAAMRRDIALVILGAILGAGVTLGLRALGLG